MEYNPSFMKLFVNFLRDRTRHFHVFQSQPSFFAILGYSGKSAL